MLRANATIFLKYWRNADLLRLWANLVWSKTTKNSIKVNNVVALLDKNGTRSKGQLGKIDKLTVNKDEKIREIEIKAAVQIMKHIILMRALQKLFLLQVKNKWWIMLVDTKRLE